MRVSSEAATPPTVAGSPAPRREQQGLPPSRTRIAGSAPGPTAAPPRAHRSPASGAPRRSPHAGQSGDADGTPRPHGGRGRPRRVPQRARTGMCAGVVGVSVDRARRHARAGKGAVRPSRRGHAAWPRMRWKEEKRHELTSGRRRSRPAPATPITVPRMALSASSRRRHRRVRRRARRVGRARRRRPRP